MTKPRGEIIVKVRYIVHTFTVCYIQMLQGKGVMYTHWLLGKTTKKISDETEGQDDFSDNDQDAAD